MYKVFLPFFLVICICFYGCSDDDTMTPNTDASDEPMEENVDRVGLANPLFQTISESWIQPYFEQDMTGIWNAGGIDRVGRNYFFMSKPDAFSCSSRFIPTSDYFQTWVGIYTVEDNAQGVYAINSGILDIDAITSLIIADQNAWLDFYGAKDPNVLINMEVPISIDLIEIDGNPGWKITFELISNIDVGNNNPQTGLPLTEIEANYWNSSVSSYQEAVLPVTSYIWHAPENSELNVAYFNLIVYENLGGQTITNTHILSELEMMLQSATVYTTQ